MKLKDTIKTLSLITLIISFTACGGGSGGSSNEEEQSIEEPTETTIDITISCVTDPSVEDIENYITLESGDTITKEGDVTIITYHDSDGEKKVCKDEDSTGTAYIVKAQ